MAVVKWTIQRMHGGWIAASVVLTNGDTSNALELPHWPQKNIHILPDSGTTISDIDIKGSGADDDPDAATNDADYLDLRQAHDNTLTFTSLTAATMADLFENPRYIKVTNYADGGGAQSTTVYVTAYTSR